MLDFFGRIWDFALANLFVITVVSIILSNGIFNVLMREANQDAKGRPQRFLLTMLLTFASGLVAVTLVNVFLTNAVIRLDKLLLPTSLGILNAFAIYSEWKAAQISLSKKGLFSFWAGLIAMVLAYQYLPGERKQMNTEQLLGVALSVGAAILFAAHAFYQQRKQEVSQASQTGTSSNLWFYAFVLTFNVIWGVIAFESKKYSIEGVPVETWILGLYGGSVLGALLIVGCIRRFEHKLGIEPTIQISLKELVLTLGMSAFMVGWVFGFYFLYQTYPLAGLQSLTMVIGMINPLWIGFLFYGERRTIDKIQALLYGIALVGGILVAWGLYLVGKS